MPRPAEAAPALIYKEGEDIYLDGEEFNPDEVTPELTSDERAAIQGAAAPDASNVFATMADVGGGGGTFEVAENSPADGVDDEFTFTGTPVIVFRNGVNETRLGTIAGSAFTFDSAPSEGDDIEALI